MIRCRLTLRQLRPVTRWTSATIFQRSNSWTSGLLTELEHRGLLADLTASRATLTSFLKTPRVVYCGIDPTAGSLHVGNLLPLLSLLHFQLTGHETIALLGGATALVGDPSGRDEERPLQSEKKILENAVELEKQLLYFFASANMYAQKRLPATMHSRQPVNVMNNLAWWRGLTLVDFLHSTGKHVRLASMLSKESVKTRMATSSGISFAEFSYQLLQAYDFWHLYKHRDCRVQIGGSDQWGNILAGLDVIARRETENLVSIEGNAYGITTPLLTTSTGQKFGKSAGNAVWLNREKTSVFDFYQFFLRTSDADVEKYLKLFTLLGDAEVDAVMRFHKSHPELRSAQRKVADEVTEMIHGEAGVSQAQAATNLLFGTKLSDIRPEEAAEALKHDPRYYAVSETELLGKPLAKLAASSGLTHSRAEATRLIEAGGLYLNNVPVNGSDQRLHREDLLGHRMAILRAGKDKHIVLALK